MKQQTSRKPASRKRASKQKYPKILAVPLSAEEILKRHNITPAEVRRVRRILSAANKQTSPAAK